MTTKNPQGLKIIPQGNFTPDEMKEAFPDIDPGFLPFGSRIIIQLRSPKNQTKGGIYLPDDSKDTEMWNTQVGMVRSVGPLAFHNRTTQEPWPEGAWAAIGDFVRVPKYNQDRWFVEYDNKQVLFLLVNDLDLLAKKLGNPLEVKAYI